MDSNPDAGASSTPTATPETVSLKKEEFDNLKKVADVSSQNFERLKKLEEENKELKEKNGASAPSVDAKFIDDKVDLRLEGYSHDEINEISVIAKAKNISLKEAKDLPFVKSAIAGMRAETKSKDNTPSPSNRGAPVYQGKSYAEVITDEKLSNEDKQAALNAVYASRRGKQHE